MYDYWKHHAKTGANLQNMMLDDNAHEYSDIEAAEILSMLPDFKNADVVEIGAGIGRFTSKIAPVCKTITAVEFIKEFSDKNRDINGHLTHATFVNADVNDFDLPENSVDFIFTNWLMMYLQDDQVNTFIKKCIKWIRPGGHFFFRESCNHQSGSKHRSFNPTVYRSPKQYNDLVTGTWTKSGDMYEGFEVVKLSTVQTYIDIKNNPNQKCWLLKHYKRTDLSQNHGEATFQQFLDKQQYSMNGILRYERVFGKDYVSSGGLETTTDFCKLIDMKPGQTVLDIGCGVGGSAFHLNQVYGCDVRGIDLSNNMIEIAQQKHADYGYQNVVFEVADATLLDYPENSFDLVYSRDTILHISDKRALFANFYKWLKPGGKVFITDYCAGPRDTWNDEFTAYVASRGYHLHTPKEYNDILASVGFDMDPNPDATDLWLDVLDAEKSKITGSEKENILKDFTQQDLQALLDGWSVKIERVNAGYRKWGKFFGRK